MVKNATGTIKVSKKHGVNPMLVVCWYCGRDTGEIAMFGWLKNDEQAPHRGVLNREPCKECKECMAAGVIFISVRDGESGENPYRTGGFAVITDDGVGRVIEDEALREHVLKSRMCFVPDATWDGLGLPRGSETIDNRNAAQIERANRALAERPRGTEDCCGHDHGHDHGHD